MAAAEQLMPSNIAAHMPLGSTIWTEAASLRPNRARLGRLQDAACRVSGSQVALTRQDKVQRSPIVKSGSQLIVQLIFPLLTLT
jgi:hypothetical protein